VYAQSIMFDENYKKQPLLLEEENSTVREAC